MCLFTTIIQTYVIFGCINDLLEAARSLIKAQPQLSFELFAKNNVDEKVDAAVDRYQQIGCFRHFKNFLSEKNFKYVRDKSENVANEKDNHNDHQHDCQFHFFLFMGRET